MIKIIGTYISDKFGELWDKSLSDLIEEAVSGVMESVCLSHKSELSKDDYYKGSSCLERRFDPREIEAIYVANMASGLFDNQLHLNAMVSQLFDHFPPSMRIEGACASGSLAMVAAENSLNSGLYKTVLVLGVEKMTDLDSNQTTKILSSASDYNFEYGSTFPSLYALLAKAHMDKYGTTREQLSSVSVKNHRHALNNPKAHFKKSFTLGQISKSTMVSDPLRLLDCSPISDGASAVILSTKKASKLLVDKDKKNSIEFSYKNKPKIIGFGHAQDSLSLAKRKDLTSLNATKKAVSIALEKANKNIDVCRDDTHDNDESDQKTKITKLTKKNTKQYKLTIKDIKVAEVHDCFTIAEILAIEDLGFFKKGTGGQATLNGKTTLGGDVVINPSGGLKACGHPVGATGVKQIAYLADLLGKDYDYALAHNVGGSGATAVVHILKK